MALAFVHGLFYDVPMDKQLQLRFDTLFMKRIHRWVLNRQPAKKYIKGQLSFIFNWKVLSN